MYKPRYRKYNLGGGIYAGSQLGGQFVDAIDTPNSYGVRSNAGALGSGALKGAGTGALAGSAILPGIGTAVGAIGGAIIGGISSLFGNNKRREAEEEAKEKQREIETNNIVQNSKGVLATYPSYGVMSAKYGIKLPNGGKLPYPTKVDAEHEVLSSNMAKYSGNTHEQGGIPLDINNDSRPEVEIEDQEVIKDDMVFSDRLNPSKIAKEMLSGIGVSINSKDTYASLSEKFGKKMGKFESNLKSTRIGERSTAELMTKQLNNAVNTLFKDQQIQKVIKGIGEGNKKGTGGIIDPQTPVRVLTKEDIITPTSNPLVKGDYSKATTDAMWKKIEANPFAVTSDKLYDVYDRESQREFDSIYGKGFNINDPNQQKLEFGQNDLIPSMHVQSKTSIPHSSYGKKYKVSDYAKGGRLPKYAYGNPPKYVPELIDGETNNIDLLGDNMSFINGQIFKKDGSRFNQVAINNSVNNSVSPISNEKLSRGLETSPVYLDTKKAIGNLAMPGYSNSVDSTEENPTFLQNLGENLGNNLGNLATATGYIANNAMINKLETQYKPELNPTPNYSFNSRLPYLSNQVSAAYRTASKGINGSSAQDNLALKANLFGKSLNSLNQATSDEFMRKDSYDRDYNQNVFRNNLFNTQNINSAKYMSQDARNQKLGLKQQNVDSLIKGIIGNKAVADQRDLEFAKNYMELLKGDETGVSGRLLKNLPAKIKRKYVGNYYNN